MRNVLVQAGLDMYFVTIIFILSMQSVSGKVEELIYKAPDSYPVPERERNSAPLCALPSINLNLSFWPQNY